MMAGGSYMRAFNREKRDVSGNLGARWQRLCSNVALALLAVLAGCGGGDGGGGTPPPPPTLATVGEKLFHDPFLSASGVLPCANCHQAHQAHADPEGTFLPFGGPTLHEQGLRSSPSLRYLDMAGPFQVLGPGLAKGGLFWDGRADSRIDQARGPLFSSVEMANADVPTFIGRLRSVPYFSELMAAASLAASASDEDLLDATLRALDAYQAADVEFHPFNSKYDAFLEGRAALTAQEARGLALFNDPASGNCAACHPSAPGPDGAKPLFTNFSYFALGVPRNASQRNADPAFFDLGLCGPRRTDLAGRSDLCGMFRVPTLRNVLRTAPYFHNAVFATLQEVVSFHATRDTNPERWYPTVGGVVQQFDDLPAIYHGNVTTVPPFGGLAGQPPPLSPQEVDDIVAFLGTLTDGIVP
jgi:cytochrome c peroxidase